MTELYQISLLAIAGFLIVILALFLLQMLVSITAICCGTSDKAAKNQSNSSLPEPTHVPISSGIIESSEQVAQSPLPEPTQVDSSISVEQRDVPSQVPRPPVLTRTIPSRQISSRTRVQNIPTLYPNAMEADVAAIIVALQQYRNRRDSLSK